MWTREKLERRLVLGINSAIIQWLPFLLSKIQDSGYSMHLETRNGSLFFSCSIYIRNGKRIFFRHILEGFFTSTKLLICWVLINHVFTSCWRYNMLSCLCTSDDSSWSFSFSSSFIWFCCCFIVSFKSSLVTAKLLPESRKYRDNLTPKYSHFCATQVSPASLRRFFLSYFPYHFVKKPLRAVDIAGNFCGISSIKACDHLSNIKVTKSPLKQVHCSEDTRLISKVC